MIETRVCIDCGESLPLTPDNFRPHKFGFRRYCKDCSKVRRIMAQYRKAEAEEMNK